MFAKKVKTKSQKVLGANSYICRSYRGKTGRWFFLVSPPPLPLILKRVKIYFVIFYWSSTIEGYNMSINRRMYLRLCSSSIDVPRKCNDNRFDKITWPWKKRFLTDLCQRIDERCSNHPDTPSRKKHLDWGGLVRTP